MYFPDPRLLQYDCGKLQVLADLLRRLKQGNHRCLIFTQMSRVLDILEKFLCMHGYTYCRLDGSTKVIHKTWRIPGQYIVNRNHMHCLVRQPCPSRMSGDGSAADDGKVQLQHQDLLLHSVNAVWWSRHEPDWSRYRYLLRLGLEPSHGCAGTGQVLEQSRSSLCQEILIG